MVVGGGWVRPECQVDRNFYAAPRTLPGPKRIKIQQLKLICAHITVAVAARVEEKPGNSKARRHNSSSNEVALERERCSFVSQAF